MHGNVHSGRGDNFRFLTGSWGARRNVLTADISLLTSDLFTHFLDANGATKNVTLPPVEEGLVRIITNVGVAGNLVVRDALTAVVTELRPGETAQLFSSGEEWRALRGWADLRVFGPSGSNHHEGLVPSPGPVAGATRFLREDGSWASVHVEGIVDSFKFITDGTNSAIAAGADTFKLRSSDNTLTVVVQNNDGTHGDNVNLVVNEAYVDHDALLNFVSDEHVPHSAVTLTAGEGLSGGGDLTSSRTFDLALSELAVETADLNDHAVFLNNGAQNRRTTWAQINALLVHDSLAGFVADEHVPHSTVSFTGTEGIVGGGSLAASSTLGLDFPGLNGVYLPAPSDVFAFYDVSENEHAQATLGELNQLFDHDTLSGFVSDEHVPHSGVSINAGTYLSGGGTITASRTLDVNVAALTPVLNHNSLLNYEANQHIDHTGVSVVAGAGLTGGGTIAASRTLNVGAGTGITVNADDVALAPIADQSFLANVAGSAAIPTALAMAGVTTLALPAAGDFILGFSAAGAIRKMNWNTLPGAASGDVTAAASLANNALIVGDGGVKGIKAHASGAPGAAAFLNVGTGAGTVAAGNDSRFPGAGSTSVAGILELATAAEYRAGTDTARALGVYETRAAGAEVTLTDAATIAVDMATFINAVVTLGGNRTLGNPTNEVAGASGVIRIVQDATGGRTLALGSQWYPGAGVTFALSTAANKQDLLFYYVVGPDFVYCSLIKGWSG
ncbi:MAG: hypothetical protein E6R03_16635 [Hyphomicrobiaceae bacterium]|nr:MAG: hypothetical protein E6R03_16635 [Hyphomicrobiaceae bacterium]